MGEAHKHAVVRREPARHEAGILEIGDADREVEPFADDVDERVGEHEVHGEVGMAVEEGQQMRRDVQAAERRGRGDPQHAARDRRPARHPGLRLLGDGEDRDDALVEALARLRHGDLARGAMQEPRAEPLLQPLHALRDHGRAR